MSRGTLTDAQSNGAPPGSCSRCGIRTTDGRSFCSDCAPVIPPGFFPSVAVSLALLIIALVVIFEVLVK
jgi:hypothetical protein